MAPQLPRLIAHRGASLVTPENTLLAFERAAELGATWLEFDVQLMACDTLIVHHDDTFHRILNYDMPVKKTLYREIKDLDAGSWFAPKFADARIPTLQQTLQCCANLQFSLNIELKTEDDTAQQNAQATLELLKTFEYYTPNNIVISSKNLLALQTVQKIAPEYALGFITGDWQTALEATQSDLKLFSLHIHHETLTQARVQQLIEQNHQVLSFTINDFDLAQQLFAWGVCSVFSDDTLLLQ